MRTAIYGLAALVGAAAFGLTGCDGKSSAVATRGTAASSAAATTPYGSEAPAQDPRDLPVPKIDGKPLWAANRKHTAEENAQYQFTRNGADFGAGAESDYVAKAHAFIEHPPKDTETIERPNGDRLMYDPKANVFAVVARTGAPRTMFKPRDGASYWAQQKDREAKRKSGGDSGATDQG